MKLLFTILFCFIFSASYCQAPEIQWENSYGGAAFDGNNVSTSGAVSICQTSDNGSITTGLTYSNNGYVSGNHGAYDIWVVKLNGKGKFKWQNA